MQGYQFMLHSLAKFTKIECAYLTSLKKRTKLLPSTDWTTEIANWTSFERLMD